MLGISATGKKCKGMEGVIEEGSEVLSASGDKSLLDLGIISAGSRVEHYEISGYKTAIALAEKMNANDVVELLQESLDEEEAAEETLRSLAEEMMTATVA